MLNPFEWGQTLPTQRPIQKERMRLLAKQSKVTELARAITPEAPFNGGPLSQIKNLKVSHLFRRRVKS